MSVSELVDIVNENDEIIGKSARSRVKPLGILYRCAGVYLEIDGKLLLEQRSAKKIIRPLNWSIVEETLHAGETYEEAAIRGVREELGLRAKNLKMIGKKRISDGNYTDDFFLCVFRASASGKPKLQKSEVEQIKFVSQQEAHKIAKNTPKTLISPGFFETINLYLDSPK